MFLRILFILFLGINLFAFNNETKQHEINLNKKLNKNLLFFLLEKKLFNKNTNITKIYIKKEYAKNYKDFVYLMGLNYLLKYKYIKNKSELQKILSNLFKNKYLNFNQAYISFLFFYLKGDINKTVYYALIIKEKSLSFIINNLLGYLYTFILNDIYYSLKDPRKKAFLMKMLKETNYYYNNNIYRCYSIFDQFTQNMCYLEYYNNLNYKYGKLIKNKYNFLFDNFLLFNLI